MVPVMKRAGRNSDAVFMTYELRDIFKAFCRKALIHHLFGQATHFVGVSCLSVAYYLFTVSWVSEESFTFFAPVHSHLDSDSSIKPCWPIDFYAVSLGYSIAFGAAHYFGRISSDAVVVHVFLHQRVTI